MEITQLARAFRYNSVDLPDPGTQYSPDAVREFYSATYPEIVNAAIEGPDEKDGKLVYTFRRAVGTKGVSALVRWQRKAELRGWAQPPESGVLSLAMSEGAWLAYWQAMDEYDRKIAAGETNPGRPVPPHRPGRAPATAWPFPTK